MERWRVLQRSDGFHWRQSIDGEALVCAPLLAVAPHVFTTRNLATTSHEAGRRLGYEAVARHLDLGPAQLHDARQVHGAAVFVAGPGPAPPEPPEADILVTAIPELGLVVRVADCVPLLLADRWTATVAAVHAGWRGTSAGAAMAAVRHLGELGCHAADLVVAMGPSIGPCCYQVGEATYEAFAAAAGLPPTRGWFTADGARWRLDLWAANHDQLVAAGVPAGAVHIARECTAHTPERYHSYRRDGARAGRLLAAIRPRPSAWHGPAGRARPD
jgi:YfiH family protein